MLSSTSPLRSETSLGDPPAQRNPGAAGGAIAPLFLTGRRARPPGALPHFALVSVDLPARLREALDARACEFGCALTTVLYAGVAALLHRLTGEADICVRTPEATVLRMHLDDDPAIRDILECARHAVEAAGRDGIGPGAEAAQLAATPESPTIAFDVRLVTVAEFIEDDEAVGDRCRDAKVEISVHCLARGDDVRVCWRFDRSVYDGETITRAAQHYLRLLESIGATIDERLSRVSLMTAQERNGRIADGQGERRAYERDSTITELWSLQVQKSPNAVAIADDESEHTYAQVEQRANSLARVLRAHGVGAGTAVGVAFDRSIDLPITLLAILKAGGVYVPLDLSYPLERLEFMIADAAIALIISREALDPQLTFAGSTLRIDAMTAPRPELADVLDPGVRADATAYITYTSGSTGRPKGVAVTHRGVARLVRSMNYVDITPADGYLQHAPLAFDASTFEIWAPLLNGARLGVPRPGLLAMSDLALAVEKFRVTTMFLTTSLFGRLVDSRLEAFGQLKALLTGGEVASPSQMCRFLDLYPGCRLIAVYGPTENTTFSTALPLTTAAAIGTSVPIGRPIGNSTAYVVDACGDLSPVGVPGELWVGGDGVATGYLNLAELTAQRFIPDPFRAPESGRVYKTGDRAVWRADGVLEFRGRTDDQVKIRGFRIELGEIEVVLAAQRGVRNAAVVAAMNRGEKGLFAFVVAADGASPAEPELRAAIGATLPHYMMPNRISVVPALPEHASGKLDRVTLARWAAHEPAATIPAMAAARDVPRPPAARPLSAERHLTQTVGDIWRDVLNLAERPAIDDNFFDAGGDSLRLLTVHARLQTELRRDIQILDLFEYSTIRKLAAFLTRTTTR